MREITISVPEWEDIPLAYKHDPDFLLEWTDFLEMRKKKKCPTTPSIEVKLLKKMLRWSKGRALAALSISSINGWQGLWEDKEYVERSQQQQVY